MCVGEAGNVISVLCAGQATKNVLMDGSAEPCYQMGHMKHETKRNEFRHIQTKELDQRRLFAETETKWLLARQLMQ